MEKLAISLKLGRVLVLEIACPVFGSCLVPVALSKRRFCGRDEKIDSDSDTAN